MRQDRLPTTSKTLLFVGVAMFGIALFVWCFDIHFPGLSETIKRHFGQSGLLFTYCGALLGANSLFWDDVFAAAKLSADRKLAAASANDAMLSQLRLRFPAVDLHQIAAAVDLALNESKSELASANAQPRIQKLSGGLGIALIVLGTILQFVALG